MRPNLRKVVTRRGRKMTDYDFRIKSAESPDFEKDSVSEPNRAVWRNEEVHRFGQIRAAHYCRHLLQPLNGSPAEPDLKPAKIRLSEINALGPTGWQAEVR